MKKTNAVAPGTRRKIKTENLKKIDLGDGVFVYTNTEGAPASIEYDKGDGNVRRVDFVT